MRWFSVPDFRLEELAFWKRQRRNSVRPHDRLGLPETGYGIKFDLTAFNQACAGSSAGAFKRAWEAEFNPSERVAAMRADIQRQLYGGPLEPRGDWAYRPGWRSAVAWLERRERDRQAEVDAAAEWPWPRRSAGLYECTYSNAAYAERCDRCNGRCWQPVRPIIQES